MFGKVLIIIGLAAAGLLLIIVNTTTPSGAGAAGILAVFLLGYIMTLVVLTYLIWIMNRAIIKAGSELHLLRRTDRLSLRKSYYYASVVALAPVIFMSLQSVGGVGIYEIALIALFVVLGCVYIARRTR